jgi:beta-galactosidase
MTSATVNIVTHIRNQDSVNHDVTLNTTIYDGAGKQVGKASSKSTIVVDSALVNSPAIPVKQEVIVYLPKVWTIDNPHLYKAISQVVVNGNVTDTYETKFGIRSFNFDSEKGFLLNGKPLKILGVCNHHDLGAFGAAVNTRALERQLQILKEMGVNGIRTSHNPPAPELLDLCDKMGFVVMDEAFDMWAKQKTPYDYHDPVPGLLAGGANPGKQDKCEGYQFSEPETTYLDADCSYSTNEIAINWNSPFVYLANSIEALQYDVRYSDKK